MTKKIVFNILALCFALLLSDGTATAQRRLLTIGDSTMSNYNEEKYSCHNEQRGWAQMLPVFLKNDIILQNAARAGRSSKSFYYEYWQDLRDTLKPGDIVFIQFGHNDEKNDGLDSEGKDKNSLGTAAWGEYLEYLTKYITESRKRGAVPVLLTSVVRAGFGEDGKLTPKSLHSLAEICGNDSLMNYPLAMKSLAGKLNVPLIDMTRMTQELIETYGYEKSKKYVYCRKDDTHLKATGGLIFARLAVKEFIRQGILTEVFIY